MMLGSDNSSVRESSSTCSLSISHTMRASLIARAPKSANHELYHLAPQVRVAGGQGAD